MLPQWVAEINLDRETLAVAIDELRVCAETCTACADACLSGKSVAQLTKCVRTDLDCADICDTTARVLSRAAAQTLQAKASVAAGKAKAVGEQARAQLPPPLEHRAEQVLSTVRQRPFQTVLVLVVLFLLVRRMLRRRSE